MRSRPALATGPDRSAVGADRRLDRRRVVAQLSETGGGGPTSRRRAAARSGAYALAGSLFLRFIGLARAVVVARLLVPSQVGRFVLASSAIGLLDVLTDPALSFALVQRPVVSKATADVVWTTTFVRGVLLTIAGLALASPAASLLRDPTVVAPMRVLALLPLVNSLASLEPLLRTREVDLVPQVRLDVSTTVIELAATVVLTAVTRSVWGLVLGSFVGAVARVIGSHLVRGYRIALRLRGGDLRTMLGFGQWVYLTSVLWFGVSSADDLIVGRSAGTGPLGLYRVAYRMGHLPLSEVSDSLQRVLFPALSRARETSEALVEQAFRRSLAVAAGLSGPLTALTVVLAPDLVRGLLGPRWTGAIVPLQILAVAGFLRALTTPASSLFMAAGRPRLDTAIHLVTAAAVLGGVAALVGPYGIQGAAWASLAATGISIPAYGVGLRRVGVSPGACLAAVAARLPVAVVAGVAAALVAHSVRSPLLGLVLGGAAASALGLALVVKTDRALTAEIRTAIGSLRGEPTGVE